MAEAGVGDIPVPNWNAIVAPPGTPRPVVERLAREIASALQAPALRTRFAALYLVPESSTPAELAEALVQGHEAWRRFIAENNIPQE